MRSHDLDFLPHTPHPAPVRLFESSNRHADADSVQMLTRASQVGEFYVMSPPQVAPDDNNRKGSCDIMIYDEESDKHVIITWKDALNATMVVPAGEEARADITSDTANVDDGNTGLKLAAEGGGDSWVKRALQVQYFNEGLTETGAAPTAESTVAKNELTAEEKDVRIVIARPFIEHMMHSAILAVSGRETVRFWPSAAPRPLTDHAPCPLPGSDALRPGGHAAERQHPSQDHRGPLFVATGSNPATPRPRDRVACSV